MEQIKVPTPPPINTGGPIGELLRLANELADEARLHVDLCAETRIRLIGGDETTKPCDPLKDNSEIGAVRELLLQVSWCLNQASADIGALV